MGWQLDFVKFHRYLKDKFRVKKAFLFIGYLEKNQKLYQKLNTAGYILIFKPTITYRSKGRKTIKGNVDAELVLQAMIEFQNYDQALIVSGDGDFHCLIEYLSQEKKMLGVLIPNKKMYSALLRNVSAKKYFLTQKLEKKLKKKRGSNLWT